MADTKPSDVDGLERWGFTWQGHDHGTHERMADGYWTPWHIAADAIAAQQARVEALERALKRIAEGDEPRPVSTSWFPDGRASKHDKCAHDVWMYEACGNCISDFAAAALKEPS